MAVILPNRDLAVRKRPHQFPRDRHGQIVAPREPGPWSAAYPGSALEGRLPADQWSIRLDPRLWPVEPADEITDGQIVWVVTSAKRVQLPGYSDIDFIKIDATMNPPEVL